MIAAEPEGVFIAPGDHNYPVATAIADDCLGTDLLFQIELPTMGTALI